MDGFTREPRDRTRGALPLAALVDVLFLLLIFFMTTSIFREQETQIEVDLAPAATATADNRPTHTTVTINRDGEVFLSNQPVSLEALRERLTRLAQSYPNEVIVVRGDKDSNLGPTVRVIDIARQAGLAEVYIKTTKDADDL